MKRPEPSPRLRAILLARALAVFVIAEGSGVFPRGWVEMVVMDRPGWGSWSSAMGRP